MSVSEAEKKSRLLKQLPEQVVSSPQELARCCEHLAACRRFGLDTEFVGEDSYHPRLCLVQVATEARLYLIDPLAVGGLDAFWKLVVDPANLVVVHAGREEVRLCHLWSGGSTPGNLFDLQIAAGLAGFTYPLSHANLVQQVLGVKMTKGETLTEWRNRPLTSAQVHYAFDDVRYLLPLWERLSARLDKLSRLSWAREEFDRLKQLSAPDVNNVLVTTDRWRKLRGLGSLDRRRLAVVRALYDWREEMAAKSNRPARTILRDDLLVEIARRNPSRARDLQVVRGLPKRSLDALVEVVQYAREVPLEKCPELAEKEQDPSQLALVSSLLTAVLGHYCVKNHLANNLVATGQDLKLLVRCTYRQEPLTEDCPLARGWRAAHILPELQAVLEGHRAIRIGNLKSQAPLKLSE